MNSTPPSTAASPPHRIMFESNKEYPPFASPLPTKNDETQLRQVRQTEPSPKALEGRVVPIHELLRRGLLGNRASGVRESRNLDPERALKDNGVNGLGGHSNECLSDKDPSGQRRLRERCPCHGGGGGAL